MKRFGDPGADFQTFGNNKTGTESSQMDSGRGEGFQTTMKWLVWWIMFNNWKGHVIGNELGVDELNRPPQRVLCLESVHRRDHHYWFHSSDGENGGRHHTRGADSRRPCKYTFPDGFQPRLPNRQSSFRLTGYAEWGSAAYLSLNWSYKKLKTIGAF